MKKFIDKNIYEPDESCIVYKFLTSRVEHFNYCYAKAVGVAANFWTNWINRWYSGTFMLNLLFLGFIPVEKFMIKRKNRQTDKQTDRLTDKKTDRQTARQTDRQADRLTDRNIDRQTNRPTNRQTHRQTDSETDR